MNLRTAPYYFLLALVAGSTTRISLVLLVPNPYALLAAGEHLATTMASRIDYGVVRLSRPSYLPALLPLKSHTTPH